jgi:hypothetical protein
MVMEWRLPRPRHGKKALGAMRWWRQLGKGDENKIATSTIVRPLGPKVFNAALV